MGTFCKAHSGGQNEYFFLFSTQSHSDKLNYHSWGQQVKNHLDFFFLAFETTCFKAIEILFPLACEEL